LYISILIGSGTGLDVKNSPPDAKPERYVPYMRDIKGDKIHSIHSKPLIGQVIIVLDDAKECIVLKNCATYYDTGIIGQFVTKFEFNSNIGLAFHEEISNQKLNTNEYCFFQILTQNAAFEAAIKSFDLQACDGAFI
jgi:hypothetical protein